MTIRGVWFALALVVLATAPGCGVDGARTASQEAEEPGPSAATVSEAPETGKTEKTGKVNMNDEELKQKLTEEQYCVTRQGGTERAFTGKYWDTKTNGVYRCVACGQPLFRSDTKFDSGTGWPSFFAPIDGEAVAEKKDRSAGMVRTEVLCSRCDSHLGHVFDDGPRPTGLRYCLNSAALDMVPDKAAEEGDE